MVGRAPAAADACEGRAEEIPCRRKQLKNRTLQQRRRHDLSLAGSRGESSYKAREVAFILDLICPTLREDVHRNHLVRSAEGTLMLQLSNVAGSANSTPQTTRMSSTCGKPADRTSSLSE